MIGFLILVVRLTLFSVIWPYHFPPLDLTKRLVISDPLVKQIPIILSFLLRMFSMFQRLVQLHPFGSLRPTDSTSCTGGVAKSSPRKTSSLWTFIISSNSGNFYFIFIFSFFPFLFSPFFFSCCLFVLILSIFFFFLFSFLYWFF